MHMRWRRLANEPRAPVSMRNLWRFLGYTRPYWKWLLVGMVAGLLRMVLPLYMPMFVKEVVDRVLVPLLDGMQSFGEAVGLLWSMLPVLLGLFVLHGVASLGRFYLPWVAGANAIRDIRLDLFWHLQRLSLSFHQRRSTGGIVSRMMSDVYSAQNAYDMIAIQASQMLLQAVAIGGFLVYRDWLWATISFATLPVFAIITRALRRPMRTASRRLQESMEQMSGETQERLSMIREVQAFTAEPYEQRRVQHTAERLREHTTRQHLLTGVLMGASEITRYAGLTVVVFFGAYRVMHGDATLGDISAFFLYVTMLLTPVQFLSTVYGRMNTAAAAADRIFQFLDAEPAVRDRPGAQPLADARPPRVRFQGVSFVYPGAEDVQVLDGVDLEIEPGTSVALVGESGGGKSTLVSLLPRFYDVTTGTVRIGEQDVRDVQLRSLRQAIAIVPQEPVLFTGTIRENILYGQPEADEQAVCEAARQANAEPFILSFPDGYDTLVGERGTGLSGGQVQRVAIARAFLKDPAILILDEATSNLDATTESLLVEAMRRLAHGRTTLIIAHRLSIARTADRIVVVHRGRIVEEGRHDELLDRDGAYAKLWTRQMEMG